MLYIFYYEFSSITIRILNLHYKFSKIFASIFLVLNAVFIPFLFYFFKSRLCFYVYRSWFSTISIYIYIYIYIYISYIKKKYSFPTFHHIGRATTRYSLTFILLLAWCTEAYIGVPKRVVLGKFVGRGNGLGVRMKRLRRHPLRGCEAQFQFFVIDKCSSTKHNVLR